MPASSACIERSFSGATHLRTPQKRSMKAQTVELLVSNNMSATKLFDRIRELTDVKNEGK